MAKPMTPAAAYRKGWVASKRTTTFDMSGPEDRFISKYGKAMWVFWCQGWTDYAAGWDKWTSFTGNATNEETK